MQVTSLQRNANSALWTANYSVYFDRFSGCLFQFTEKPLLPSPSPYQFAAESWTNYLSFFSFHINELLQSFYSNNWNTAVPREHCLTQGLWSKVEKTEANLFTNMLRAHDISGCNTIALGKDIFTSVLNSVNTILS